MAKYVVQMLYRDTGGIFWDDVTPEYDTRERAEKELAIRRAWSATAPEFDFLDGADLRVHCYRAKPARRKPKPVERRRLIDPPGVLPPVLRKRAP